MARPPAESPRRDPDQIALSIVEAVATTVGKIALRLGPGLVLNGTADRRSCDAYATIRDLVEYVNVGAVGDWGGSEDAAASAAEAAEELAYLVAVLRGSGDADALAACIDADNIIAATGARTCAVLGPQVRVADLAALTGVAAHTIRQAVAKGALTEAPAYARLGMCVTPESARAWLTAREAT